MIRIPSAAVGRTLVAIRLGYALIDWCEETLEFTGLSLFALTLLGRLQGRALVFSAPGDEPLRPPGDAPTPHQNC